MPPYDVFASPSGYSRYGLYGPPAGLADEPIDPRRYNGDVVGVEYLVRSGPGNPESLPGYFSGPGLSKGYTTSILPTPTDRGEVVSVDYIRHGPHDEGYVYSPRHTTYPRESYHQRSVPFAAVPNHDFVNRNHIKAGRPWLGVGLKWIDSLQKEKGKIAVVGDVLSGSPAAEAGILPGDFIGYWERDRLSDKSVWESKLANMNVGDLVTLGVQRDGRSFPVPVEIKSNPHSNHQHQRSMPEPMGHPIGQPKDMTRPGRPWFGVGLDWINSIQDSGSKIAVVKDVLPRSPAHEAGLQVGDYITFWEQTRLSNTDLWNSKMANVGVGDIVTLGVQRDGRAFPVPVRFTARP